MLVLRWTQGREELGLSPDSNKSLDRARRTHLSGREFPDRCFFSSHAFSLLCQRRLFLVPNFSNNVSCVLQLLLLPSLNTTLLFSSASTSP